MSEREAFETWAWENGLQSHTDQSLDYPLGNVLWKCWQARAAVQANVPDVDSAYVAGWVTAAKWASREDLISDIGSDAFDRDRQEAFRRLSAIPKG